MPASLRILIYFAGSPAEVVTNLIPCSTIKLTILSSLRNNKGKFIPKGLSVSSAIFLISSLQFSTSPEEVSIIPKPPAFDTAEAS